MMASDDFMPSGRKRVGWIDICKGICILLVVLLHSTSYYKFTGGVVPDAVNRLANGLAPIRMPSLIFLSGLMINFSLRKGTGPFLVRRATILIWPYILWNIIWAFASDNVAKMTDGYWWLGNWHMWFLFFIIVYSLVAVIIPRKYHAMFAIYAYLLSLAMDDGTKYGERLFFFMSLFMIGSAVGQNLPRLERLLARGKVLLLLPAGIGILLYSALYGPVRYSPHDYGMIAIIVFLTMALCYRIADGTPWPFLATMGRNSLTIYMVHMPVIALVMSGYRSAGMDYFYPVFLTSFLLSMAVSIAMIRLRKSVPVVDWLFAFPLKRKAMPGGASRPIGARMS